MKTLIPICAALLLLFSLSTSAQVAPNNLFVYLSWLANDESEHVDRYRVEWSDGGQNWVNLGDVVAPQSLEPVRFSTRVAWLKNTIAVGMTVCFRVIALRGSDESEPSPNGCGEIQATPETSDNNITRPAAPSVEYRYE